MSDQRRITGRQGEALAATYLEQHGYGIIAKNWRCALGEIDLIVLDQTTLVFVEVRTRRSAVAGLAEESVTLAKRRRLAALADAYLQHRADTANPWLGSWRIDVVAVHIGADGLIRLRHLQHAVEIN